MVEREDFRTRVDLIGREICLAASPSFPVQYLESISYLLDLILADNQALPLVTLTTPTLSLYIYIYMYAFSYE